MIRTQQAKEEADQDQEGATNAGTVERQATGLTNAEAEDATRTETEVGRDAEVTLVIEDGPHQEAEDQAVVIQGMLIEEKEGVSVVRREATLEQTARKILVVVEEILVMWTEEEMIVDTVVAEMVPEEETTREVDLHQDVVLVEIMTPLGNLQEVALPHLVITEKNVMIAEVPILGLTTDYRFLQPESKLAQT